MKLLRNMIALLLVLTFVFAAAACGNEKEEKNESESETTASGADEEPVSPDDRWICSEHFNVDEGMLNYLYSSFVVEFVQSDTYQTSESKLFDPQQPLSGQTCNLDTQGQTWHQYFIDLTVNRTYENLLLAEGAYESGTELDEDDMKTVDEYMASIEKDAKTYGLSTDNYVRHMFGDSVSADSVRKACELTALADKQRQALRDSFNISTEDCETYYGNNKSAFDKVDLRYYNIIADIPEGASDDEVQAAKDKAKAVAEEFAAVKSEEEFIELVYKYMLEENSTLEDPLSDESVKITAQNNKAVGRINGGSNVDNWLFNASRKAGDAAYFITADDQYTAVYMLTPVYREEYRYKNVRHILLFGDNYGSEEMLEAQKDELQAAWDASEKTEDAFIELSEKYNEDVYSLYENVTKGKMTKSFEDWCFDETRKSGDCEMISAEYGYHLMYFVDEGDVVWESMAKEAIYREKYEKTILDYDDKYSVEINDQNVIRLRDFNYFMVSELTPVATEEVTGDVTEEVTVG